MTRQEALDLILPYLERGEEFDHEASAIDWAYKAAVSADEYRTFLADVHERLSATFEPS
jgi:hypothetical protein